MEFHNTYQDTTRAAAYNELEVGGTYDLVFRNLHGLLEQHVTGRRAVDFGCGTGRSSRFLRSLGFEPIGIDISAEMVALARERDPAGDYRVIEDGDFSSLVQLGHDIVLSAFTFDNIPGRDRKIRLFTGLRRLLRRGGRLINIVSTPEIYTNEWATFSTCNYPENHSAVCGEVVRIVTTDYSDARPVDDILWPDEDYRDVFAQAGLSVERMERPVAAGDERFEWVSETEIAPWSIYVLRATQEVRYD